MKKQHVILCCGLALIVLAGAVYFGKWEFDKNRAVKESVEASISEKRKDMEEDYIPHVYKDIHDAFPVDEGHSRYVTSEHLDEGCMYAYLCVYNEWAKKRDSNFKDLTLQEVREYLDSGEITVDYVIDNNLNTLYQIMLYGMSDRIKAYFDWYRSDDGYPVLEKYMYDLTDKYLQLRDELRDKHPENEKLPYMTAYYMNYKQICELIEYDRSGKLEDFDTSVFTGK